LSLASAVRWTGRTMMGPSLCRSIASQANSGRASSRQPTGTRTTIPSSWTRTWIYGTTRSRSAPPSHRSREPASRSHRRLHGARSAPTSLRRWPWPRGQASTTCRRCSPHRRHRLCIEPGRGDRPAARTAATLPLYGTLGRQAASGAGLRRRCYRRGAAQRGATRPPPWASSCQHPMAKPPAAVDLGGPGPEGHQLQLSDHAARSRSTGPVRSRGGTIWIRTSEASPLPSRVQDSRRPLPSP
jgi:hypothetical protein